MCGCGASRREAGREGQKRVGRENACEQRVNGGQAMDQWSVGDLKLNLDRKPECLRVDWRGRSNHLAPKVHLFPYFNWLIEAARRDDRPVEMHFEELEHFNSATMAAIIDLIHQAQDMNVALVFSYDP